MLTGDINNINIIYKQDHLITLEFISNDRNYMYQGEVNKDNNMHGYGKLWNNNYSYHGYFKNNELSGEGIITYTGSMDYSSLQSIKNFMIYYKGEYLNNKKNGKGFEKYLNNEYYEGNFYNDLKHGEGSLYNHNGEIKINGFWDLGKPIDTKHITEYYQNGFLKYKGEYNGTNRHGKGTYFNNSGLIIFEGEFYDDGSFKNGKLYNNNLICFEGEFIDNMPFKGTFYWTNGIKLGVATIEKKNNENYFFGVTTIYKPTGGILFSGDLILQNKIIDIQRISKYFVVCDNKTIDYNIYFGSGIVYNFDIKSSHEKGLSNIIKMNDNNELHGEQIEYQKNGKPKIINNYNNGSKEGITTFYSDNNEIEVTKTYKNNYKNGTTTIFRDNKIHQQIEYKNDISTFIFSVSFDRYKVV